MRIPNGIARGVDQAIIKWIYKEINSEQRLISKTSLFIHSDNEIVLPVCVLCLLTRIS